MMLSLPLVLFVLAAGLVAVFWQNSLGARERANRAAQEACERMNLQFLDGTVAFARLSLARDGGQLTLRRTYVFDYAAASIDRSQGFVMLLGQRIESIGFAPGTVDAAAMRSAPPVQINPLRTADADQETGKILNLEDFRQRRKTSRSEAPDSRSPGNSSDQSW